MSREIKWDRNLHIGRGKDALDLFPSHLLKYIILQYSHVGCHLFDFPGCYKIFGSILNSRI